MNNKQIVKLSDKLQKKVLSQVQPKVEEQIKSAFAELESNWAIRERFIKEQTKKEFLEKIDKIEKEMFDRCTMSEEEIVVEYTDKLRQQLK
jgi:hypothetical protein